MTTDQTMQAQGATLAPVAWMSKSKTSPEDWPRLGDRRQLEQDYDASHGYGVQANRARQKDMTPLVSLDEAMRLINTLRFALKGLHDDVAEYARINHLGGFDNHWMKAAREALGEQPCDLQMRLDALGVAIADAGYTWTPAMRAAYEGR